MADELDEHPVRNQPNHVAGTPIIPHDQNIQSPPMMSKSDPASESDEASTVTDNETNVETNERGLGDADADLEDWEQELDNMIKSNTKIHDWKTLHDQIQKDLYTSSKTLPLTQINQLRLLSNFATLRLKGVSRIDASLDIAQQWHSGKGIWFARQIRALACHYQVFEQLPAEKQCGKNAHSFLHGESVQNCTQTWLSSLPTRQVTPRALQAALTTTIFPELGIVPKHPISEQTARHWLIKLG